MPLSSFPSAKSAIECGEASRAVLDPADERRWRVYLPRPRGVAKTSSHSPRPLLTGGRMLMASLGPSSVTRPRPRPFPLPGPCLRSPSGRGPGVEAGCSGYGLCEGRLDIHVQPYGRDDDGGSSGGSRPPRRPRAGALARLCLCAGGQRSRRRSRRRKSSSRTWSTAVSWCSQKGEGRPYLHYQAFETDSAPTSTRWALSKRTS